MLINEPKGVVRVSQFEPNVTFAETGWAMRKVSLGEDVTAISYHAAMGSYVLGTSEEVEFELPKDDDFRKNWATEGELLRTFSGLVIES